MLTLGQELYNLTARDRETIFLDQVFRSYALPCPGGVDTNVLSVGIPVDRSFYIDRVIALLAGWVGVGNWTQWNLALGDAGGFNTLVCIRGEGGAAGRSIISDGSNPTVAPVPGEGCYQTIDIKTVFPPGFVNLAFSAMTLGRGAVATVANFRIHGYYIPPGGIARR